MKDRQIQSTEHQQKIKCNFASLKGTETNREYWYRSKGYLVAEWTILVKDNNKDVSERYW